MTIEVYLPTTLSWFPVFIQYFDWNTIQWNEMQFNLIILFFLFPPLFFK